MNGFPTLDVHLPRTTPYPSAPTLQQAARAERRSAAPDSVLTPDQLLELYDLLPDPSLMATDPDSAVSPLRRWMRDHPELIVRLPANYIVRLALSQAQRARVNATTSPLAGTYRLVLTMPPGDSVAFFARTSVHPSGELKRLTSARLPSRAERSTDLEPSPSVGYYLMAYVATDREDLPTVQTRESIDRQGYFAALFAPEVETPDSTVWQGSVDLIDHAARLLPRGDLRSRIEAARATLWSMLRSGEHTFVPGRFVLRADGSVVYTLDATRNGVQVLSIRGERISADYVREP